MIVPGSPHALLMAGGSDPLDELGVIARSLRTRPSASARLSWTPVSSGNRQTWTLNFWSKRAGALGTNPILFCADGTHDNTNYAEISYNASAEQLYYTGWTSSYRNSAASFRDFGSHDNIQINYDSTQAVENDRLTLTINGVRQTFSTSVLSVALNAASAINAGGVAHGIGGRSGSGFFDGEHSFYAFVDGQNLPATTFAQFHPLTKQWRPKSKAAITAVVNAGGANSWFLPFDNVTNLTTLCADASNKGNNWTAINVSLTAGTTYDSLTDTPTNNFCVLNYLDFPNTGQTLSNGNLTASGGGQYSTAAGTIGMVNGKWIFDIEITTASTGPIGLGAGATSKSLSQVSFYPGQDSTSWGMYTGGVDNGKLYNNGTALGTFFTFAQLDLVILALDIDAGKGWYGKYSGSTLTWATNGGVGNPATGAFPTFTFTPGLKLKPLVRTETGLTATANFGQRVTPYSLPSGFNSLNTKNFTLPANPYVGAAYAAVTDTGANVQATLAAARPGWTNYIEIFKRQDSAEGWRWRFSDDLASYLDSSSTAGKAAFPTLSGTAYMGYAIKVGAINGVAMGRLTHVGGVADTVTDGLGTSRKMLILKNEATGTWYVYHPDLTAGKLFYLETTSGETTDATIGTVTTNSFVVAAALASGTYRWIAFGEVDGFLSLSKYLANGSADGPFGYAGLTPSFLLQRSTSGSSCRLKDIVRSPYNVSTISFNLNDTTAQDASSNSVDIVSNGMKERANDAMNVSGQTFITMAIGEAFRYANAR